MAASYTCDGCGCNVSKPKQVGHVVKRDYCRECEVVAGVFLETEESYRKEAQERFAEKRNALIAKYGANNFKLPDVP